MLLRALRLPLSLPLVPKAFALAPSACTSRTGPLRIDMFGAAFFGVGLALSMALSRLGGMVLDDRWPFPVSGKVVVSEKRVRSSEVDM